MKKMLDLMTDTPLVEIVNFKRNKGARIFAKLEGFNAGGSVKDRIARYMIEDAEKRGLLTKDKIILEPTSGNTGIGLAMMAAIKGYKLRIVMPESMSLERRRVVQAYGAEVILTPAEEGMNGAISTAQEMASDRKYFIPNQFENENNPRAHYETTGPEILKAVGEVDIFVAGIGTGGTVMGVGRRLRETNPKVKIVGIEPYLNSKIQGLKNLDEGYVPPIFKIEMLSEKVNVSDEDAFETARRLAKEEGLLVGISSGAAMFEALSQAEELGEGNVIVVLPDRGDKYLSTALFPECPCWKMQCPKVRADGS